MSSFSEIMRARTEEEAARIKRNGEEKHQDLVSDCITLSETGTKLGRNQILPLFTPSFPDPCCFPHV